MRVTSKDQMEIGRVYRLVHSPQWPLSTGLIVKWIPDERHDSIGLVLYSPTDRWCVGQCRSFHPGIEEYELLSPEEEAMYLMQ